MTTAYFLVTGGLLFMASAPRADVFFRGCTTICPGPGTGEFDIFRVALGMGRRGCEGTIGTGLRLATLGIPMSAAILLDPTGGPPPSLGVTLRVYRGRTLTGGIYSTSPSLPVSHLFLLPLGRRGFSVGPLGSLLLETELLRFQLPEYGGGYPSESIKP